MRRVLDLLLPIVRRINPRIAMLVAVVAAGGGAVWQGFAHMAATQKGPTKQIATGLTPTPVTGAVQPASASLSDDQLPASPGGNHRLTGYGQVSDSSPSYRSDSSNQPQTANSYLPSSSDPAGGSASSRSSSSRYGSGSSLYGYGESTSPAAAVPQDPTATTVPESVPGNPYRQGATAAGTTAPAYRSSESPPATATVTEASPPATMVPSEGATEYAKRYGFGANASNHPPAAPPTTPSASATAPPANLAAIVPVTAAPLNALPRADALSNPYASATGGHSLAPAAIASSIAPIGQRNGLGAGLLSRTDSAGKSAAPTPGERQLEGAQQPALTLEKISPSEIQVGKPATFELHIHNVGRVPAAGVVVTDHVPSGTQLIEARPPTQQAADGSLAWQLGALQPGEETQITLQVMPLTEGEIGSTASVTFAAAATSRSICTRPQLAIEHTAPPKVLIGESLGVAITISNPGTGPATGVIIDEDVPDGLSHAAGSQLEYEIGILRPGESKRLELSLRAERAGVVQNTIRVRGDANLAAQHTVQIEVVAPQLQVSIEGPKRRFLERQATYTLQIANAGTAAARDVELVAFLPRGMKFVTSDSQGQYDPGQHAVLWSLAELPSQKGGAVKLTMLPVEPGEQKLRVEGRAALNLATTGEQLIQVDQAAELLHTVKDLDEVIEVGSETAYEIRVVNKGTKAATNVRLAALMPPGMAAVRGEGPTRAGGDAAQVAFEPLPRLNPNEEVIFKVQARGVQPGDQIVRVQLSSDEWPTPVTREESTRVYQDR